PAKIMVQWDGVVKILAFGVSSMGALSAQAAGNAPDTLYYMSPEQLHCDPLDARSNLFSLGAILYEMVTEHKAFPGENADEVRQVILQAAPVPPRHINPKANLALSEVIMKALSKAPEHRYQSAQELLTDLEKCKNNPEKAANLPKPNQAAKTKSVSQPAAVPEISQTEVAEPKKMPKAAAAAAGQGFSASASASVVARSAVSVPTEQLPTMSSATVVEAEAEAPHIAVDPLMDETRNDSGKQSHSFSEISELPPLKENYIAPPPPPSPVQQPEAPDPIRAAVFRSSAPEKPKVQPKEVAKKAVAEITKTPPKLFGYAIAAAIAVILLVVAGIAYHIHSENSDDDGSAQSSARSSSAQPGTTQAEASQPAPDAQAVESTQAAPPITTDDPSVVAVQPKYKVGKKKSKATPAPVGATVIPGQLTVNTTPQGAQVTVDGQNDSGWVTPYNMAGLVPGQHTVIVSKVGYAPETRNVDVTSGSKVFLVVQLAQLTAAVSVVSTPPGAAVLMDGKDTGHITPMQLSVEKPGNHTFLFRKQGYLDETTTANLQPGQTVHLSPALKALGATDDIKIGGKFKKLFGGSDVAGMGTVSVKTQPKGAQIAINNRMLDKASPVEFYLNPGTYVVDMTLSGYKSVQKVINVEKGGKVPVEETLERQ
ncbi:MAG: hypothetical protein JWO91_2630, partial [Acidobacteriaceae bacterium]|nr:hypothetical protein [Acidobacteriaceae bacterium]